MGLDNLLPELLNMFIDCTKFNHLLSSNMETITLDSQFTVCTKKKRMSPGL